MLVGSINQYSHEADAADEHYRSKVPALSITTYKTQRLTTNKIMVDFQLFSAQDAVSVI